MARIRTIKPEFFTSEDIVALSPLARLLYIALWCEADKEGRLTWRPTTFKLRYLPADNCDIKALCKEITDAGLVVLYGDSLAYIPGFAKHQHVNPRESASTLPEPSDHDQCKSRIDASPRVSTRANQELTDREEGKGRERKGKEDASHDTSLFDRFWQAYPRKEGKDAAKKAFAKRKPDDGLLASMLSTLAVQIHSPQWERDGGQFIPHPATWLNQGRWQDEVAVVDDTCSTPDWLRGAI